MNLIQENDLVIVPDKYDGISEQIFKVLQTDYISKFRRDLLKVQSLQTGSVLHFLEDDVMLLSHGNIVQEVTESIGDRIW